MKINEFAQATANNMVQKQGVPQAVAFDPIIIMVLIEIINIIIEKWNECNKPAVELQKTVSIGLSFWQRFLLRRWIHKAINDSKLEPKIYQAVLEKGGELKAEEIEEMLKEHGE